MVRTQIYLTEDEQAKLRSLSRRSGRKQSELVREAVDDFLERTTLGAGRDHLRKFRGMWKGRDASEFRAIRHELERRIGK